MINKKFKLVGAGIAAIAVLIFYLGFTAQGIESQLTVQRTKMRDISVSWNSADGLSANCEVYQRIMFWQDYEYAMSFNIDSGDTFLINRENLSPIYRDMKFVCVSGEQTVSVNTVFAMGALIINQEAQNCPALSCPTTTTTIPIPNPTCESQGYIFPSDCGSNGWYASCNSCCPTCHTFNQHCESNSDCCGGLYCQTWSSHKCKNLW